MLLQCVSYNDTTDEIFYHGLILGLCTMFDNRYYVTSHRESGEGRFDIQLAPTNTKLPGILIELKVGKESTDSGLGKLARTALQQIEGRHYDTEMITRSITSIIKSGVAFCGKKVSIVSAKQRNTPCLYLVQYKSVSLNFTKSVLPIKILPVFLKF